MTNGVVVVVAGREVEVEVEVMVEVEVGVVVEVVVGVVLISGQGCPMRKIPAEQKQAKKVELVGEGDGR